MKIGKIPNDILKNIVIDTITKNSENKDIILKPNIGEDCSVIDLKDEYCVISSDPITGACENIGKLAVSVNINDIVSTGAIPIGISTTILLPPNSSEETLRIIINQIQTEAKKFGVEIIGGHTEVTDAVTRPVISSTIIGKTINKRIISSSGCNVGDSVIMTKFAGIEGTYIISQDKKDEVENILIEESSFDFENMITIFPEAKVCMDLGVSSMHDVTEGGVLGACHEIAQCSNLGIEVDCDKIPVLSITKRICEKFNINPLKLISSGTLLITCSNQKKDIIIDNLKSKNINATEIGKIINSGYYYIENGKKMCLNQPESDELFNVL